MIDACLCTASEAGRILNGFVTITEQAAPSAVPGDRHISYLPLAHIYERVTQVTAVYAGCAIGFFM